MQTLNHVENVPIQVIKYLDAGSFSQVFLCQTPTTMAVLKITSSQEHMQSISRELQVFKMLNMSQSEYLKKFIVGYIAGETTAHHACLLLEFCKMNLVQYMNSMLPNQLPLTTVLHIMYDISQAVYFLHANKIIHRDLKLENVLLRETNHSIDYYEPSYCLCDFGSCSNYTLASNTLPTNIVQVQSDIEQHTTMQYRSPELIDLHLKRGISNKLDVWALGCLLYKLIFYVNPFENEYGILSYSNNINALLQPIKQIPPALVTILEKSLLVNPLERWTSYQFLKALCEIKNTTCPLPNIFEDSAVQHTQVHMADKSAHPLLKAQTNNSLVEEQIQMSDLAQQRRQNRDNKRQLKPSGFPDIRDFEEQLQNPQSQNIQTIQNNSQFPDLKDFEQSNDPFSQHTTQPIEPTTQISYTEPRKQSLKNFTIQSTPIELMQSVLHSNDLESVGLVLKWSWQQFHAKQDPIQAILTQIRHLVGQLGVTTTNTRGVFRSLLVIHSLVLYGPDTVCKQSQLLPLLNGLETIQNKMSIFYARYVRESIAFKAKYNMTGRYRSQGKVEYCKLILSQLSINFDRFLNMKEAMGYHGDIGLCLYLFIQDSIIGIVAAQEYSKNGNFYLFRSFNECIYKTDMEEV